MKKLAWKTKTVRYTRQTWSRELGGLIWVVKLGHENWAGNPTCMRVVSPEKR